MPSAPVPPAPAAAPPAAAAAVIDANKSGIENALSRYRRAFNMLDVVATREVWPTVNERTLSRAFERLERQNVAFDNCQIDVNNERAEARCSGTARYVPRVGSRTTHVDQRQWRFTLVKVKDEWLIGAVDAR
jgi:Zn finger protein HypA/HybF involved in hydrogenase expression